MRKLPNAALMPCNIWQNNSSCKLGYSESRRRDRCDECFLVVMRPPRALLSRQARIIIQTPSASATPAEIPLYKLDGFFTSISATKTVNSSPAMSTRASLWLRFSCAKYPIANNITYHPPSMNMIIIHKNELVTHSMLFSQLVATSLIPPMTIRSVITAS